jgi:hypothetical protein
MPCTEAEKDAVWAQRRKETAFVDTFIHAPNQHDSDRSSNLRATASSRLRNQGLNEISLFSKIQDSHTPNKNATAGTERPKKILQRNFCAVLRDGNTKKY